MNEVIMRQTRQSDYKALTLSHRSFMVGLRHSPWYVCGVWCLTYLIWKRSFMWHGESLKIQRNRQVINQLSPHHDSQFSAFSTEVLDQMNRKHNRGSSPFTTLDDRAECRIARTGAGHPNYWPKTWFGADAYKAKIVMTNYDIKLFGLFRNTYVAVSSPWRFEPRCACETTGDAKFSSGKSKYWIRIYVH